LIVDDEQAARVGLTEIIGAWGYETHSAGDGVEALEIAKIFQPGAVITDVFMPRLDGFSTAEALQTTTAGAAEACGVTDRTGRLAAGLAADVLVVDGDLRGDLEALARPVTVLAGGVEARA